MGISLRGGGESSMCPSALRYRSAREEVRDVSAERRIRSLTALLTLELGNLAVGVVQSRVVPGHDQLLGAVQPGSRVGLGSKLGGCRRERKEKGQSRERLKDNGKARTTVEGSDADDTHDDADQGDSRNSRLGESLAGGGGSPELLETADRRHCQREYRGKAVSKLFSIPTQRPPSPMGVGGLSLPRDPTRWPLPGLRDRT